MCKVKVFSYQRSSGKRVDFQIIIIPGSMSLHWKVLSDPEMMLLQDTIDPLQESDCLELTFISRLSNTLRTSLKPDNEDQLYCP
ncbi:hypothetical protein F7725_025571 [Dissostichus mawsoni]|uniref:Uncharacterized protein n=1 Tax=Dissostichus mawsoni TaxID=36200 RepID=A0A7J5XCT6_DISMA|nr:hypothetical protein F7725_025571 [Dissostichus mawsoni]